jgi:HEAT repeat protein
LIRVSEPTIPAGEPIPEPPPERQTTPFLVLQFFIFPMAIVAVCVAVFVIFGLIASEGGGAREYLSEVRTGGANRRWQAAFELSKVLQARKDPALTDPKFVNELITVFRESASDDPRVRRYLAVALGRLGDPRAVPALLAAVKSADATDGPSSDSATLIYAVWALGAIGDPAAEADLVRLAKSEDAGLRKTAVHALGGFGSTEAGDALSAALADPANDVRWNAALALARRKDAAAAPILLEMTDRQRLAEVKELGPEQREEVILQAVAAAAVIPDPALRSNLEKLRDGDPSLKVREAARRALGGKSPGSALP